MSQKTGDRAALAKQLRAWADLIGDQVPGGVVAEMQAIANDLELVWEPPEGFRRLLEEVETHPELDAIQESLDDLVDITRSEGTSGINNEGPAGQLEYLVREANLPLAEIRESLRLGYSQRR